GAVCISSGFFFQAEDGIRDFHVTGVQTCALPISPEENPPTFTFVAVQPGDTLWKLSNRYHANMDDIVRANPWLQGAADGALPAEIGRASCRERGQLGGVG